MVLEGLRNRIGAAVGRLRGKHKLDEETVTELSRQLRKAFLEADFNVRQTKEITERLERRLLEEERRPGLAVQTHAMNIVYTELVRMLGSPREIQPRDITILLVGLYGQGKTTSTAKLATWWKRRHGGKIAVIEADVHRPGAYAQLQQLLADEDITVYGEEDADDAVSLVKRGLEYTRTADVTIIDTAGRHQLDEELVAELEEISRIAMADERLLVIDAQVGQAAGPVAASFHRLVDITGVIVTKLDGTARGGGALSAVAATEAPILHIGVGETIRDLESFDGNRFISRLLGMGDIEGLIELAPEDLDEEEAMRLAGRLMSGRFTLRDMYQQMEMMSKIGTLDRILSHMPAGLFGGLGQMNRAQKEEMQNNLDRYRVIMDSMTAKEKSSPPLIKSDRLRRIARGSGASEKEVKGLLSQWNRSRKMMKGIKGNRQMQKQLNQMMREGAFEDVDFIQ